MLLDGVPGGGGGVQAASSQCVVDLPFAPGALGEDVLSFTSAPVHTHTHTHTHTHSWFGVKYKDNFIHVEGVAY
jgi:hypothetical protein